MLALSTTSILTTLLYATASAWTSNPQIPNSADMASLPLVQLPSTACLPDGKCFNELMTCVNNNCIDNRTVAEKLALRKALDVALSSAQLGSLCKLDSDCLPDTCCSVDGKCSARESSQCGGPKTQATINVPSRLGAICHLNSGCQTGCCSRVYGICMVGENQQCLPQSPSSVKDEL